jgi:hypothetical protein
VERRPAIRQGSRSSSEGQVITYYTIFALKLFCIVAIVVFEDLRKNP